MVGDLVGGGAPLTESGPVGVGGECVDEGGLGEDVKVEEGVLFGEGIGLVSFSDVADGGEVSSDGLCSEDALEVSFEGDAIGADEEGDMLLLSPEEKRS